MGVLWVGKSSFPDAEVKVVHCHHQVGIERRAFDAEDRAAVCFLVVANEDVVGFGFVFTAFSCATFTANIAAGLSSPINEYQLTFEGASPEGRRSLALFKQNPAETDVWRVLVEDLQEQEWLPGFCALLEHFLAHVTAIPDAHIPVLRYRHKVFAYSFVVILLVDLNRAGNKRQV